MGCFVCLFCFCFGFFFVGLFVFLEAWEKVIVANKLPSVLWDLEICAAFPPLWYSVLSVSPQFSCLYACNILAKHGSATLSILQMEK